jgi:hypothetical protein
MRIGIARAVIMIVAVGLVGVAAVGLSYSVALLTLDGTEGGAQVYGSFILAGALVVGVVGLGLYALAIRR